MSQLLALNTYKQVSYVQNNNNNTILLLFDPSNCEIHMCVCTICFIAANSHSLPLICWLLAAVSSFGSLVTVVFVLVVVVVACLFLGWQHSYFPLIAGITHFNGIPLCGTYVRACVCACVWEYACDTLSMHAFAFLRFYCSIMLKASNQQVFLWLHGAFYEHLAIKM